MGKDHLKDTRRFLERNEDHSLDNGKGKWLRDNGLSIVNELYDVGCISVQSFSSDFEYVQVPMYYSRTLYITIPKKVEQIAKIVQCILKLGFDELVSDKGNPRLWKLNWTEGEFRGESWRR